MYYADILLILLFIIRAVIIRIYEIKHPTKKQEYYLADQDQIALNVLHEPARTLVANLIERQLAYCIKLNQYDYKNVIINYVYDFNEIALNLERSHDKYIK